MALDPVSISILLLAGIIIASLGAMTGLGGGFLCVPFLLLIWNMGKEEAVLTSLTMIMANSISSSFSYVRSKMVDFKVVVLLVVPAIPALYIGFFLLKNLDTAIFNLLFSILLISVTTYILISRTENKRNKENNTNNAEKMEKKRNLYPQFSIPLSFLTGIASSAFGIGGGAILMPLQISLLKMDVRKAIATSMFLLMLLSGFRVLVISGAGFDPYVALPLASGALIGAQIGARIVKRLKRQILLYILSSFLFIIAVYMGGTAIVSFL